MPVEWVETARHLNERVEKHENLHADLIAEIKDRLSAAEDHITSIRLFNAKIIGVLLGVSALSEVLRSVLHKVLP